MRLLREKGIPAVPTFAIFEYFAPPAGAADARGERLRLEYKIDECKRQIAAGVPFAVPGNPLDDIHVLRRVSFVMKGGVIYKP